MELEAADENNKAYWSRFNVAEGVEQILGSVAEVNEAGNLVMFDNEGSFSF